MRKDDPLLRIYIPTIIYQTIYLPPDQKFSELLRIIQDWIEEDEPDNIKSMDRIAKEDYVLVMREFLTLHSPSAVRELVGNIRKIGRESLYLDDLVKKFGSIHAEILFEMAAISNEYNAKILAFGEKTSSMFKTIGTHIVKGSSRVKKLIKSKSKVRTPVNIMIYFFVPAEPIYTFIQEFKIDGVEGLLDPRLVAPLGWFLIANS